MANKVTPMSTAGKVSHMIDFVDRNPNVIFPHQFFNIKFNEVFAEPDPGVHSFNCVWKASYLAYAYTRLWTYRLCSLFGVFSAFCFGLEYGCTACYMIWCCWPCLILQRWRCQPLVKAINIMIECCCMPCIRAYSMLLYNIRVVVVKGNAEEVH